MLFQEAEARKWTNTYTQRQRTVTQKGLFSQRPEQEEREDSYKRLSGQMRFKACDSKVVRKKLSSQVMGEYNHILEKV